MSKWCWSCSSYSVSAGFPTTPTSFTSTSTLRWWTWRTSNTSSSGFTGLRCHMPWSTPLHTASSTQSKTKQTKTQGSNEILSCKVCRKFGKLILPNFIESISNALKILIISSKRFDNLNFENAQCPKASKRLFDQVQFGIEIFKNALCKK